jgi:hypothetical protein
MLEQVKVLPQLQQYEYLSREIYIFFLQKDESHSIFSICAKELANTASSLLLHTHHCSFLK